MFTTEAEGSGYQLLQGVDEVLQVNVISVGSDVGKEELIDPLSDLTLENHRQNCHSQLQDEDESNQTRKLLIERDKSKPTDHMIKCFNYNQTNMF